MARLDAAAAAGAYFIVPGVSSRFDHSQLHAIMGPSGCGKTTLCRALAGRLPMSRVCGNVNMLCSSAADGFRSESELVVCDSLGECNASHELCQTTGFVPQFDLLHETLTVSDSHTTSTGLPYTFVYEGCAPLTNNRWCILWETCCVLPPCLWGAIIMAYEPRLRWPLVN